MDYKSLKILSLIGFSLCLAAILPAPAFSHALPGTYHYLTIHGRDISYRLIISGIDMCRLTHWDCEDLSESDLERLRNASHEIEAKLNRGIQLFSKNHRLTLQMQTINPLPFGFEITLTSHTPFPICSLTIHYILLEKENPAFQSFFTISSKSGEASSHLMILNREHSYLEWHLDRPALVHSKASLRKRLLDLQAYITRDLTTPWLAIGFLMAFFLGIGHAFTPGHGKSLMAAYLVGQHGHIKDAIVMGLTTTVTHTFSVILLGLMIMFFSHIILPSTLFPWVARISAFLIIAMGVYVLYTRIKEKKSPKHHLHSHLHIHSHEHNDSFHSHHSYTRSHTWQAFWLSFSGGIIPCPSAMAVLFAAISLGKIGYGILMILVFSLGLGATLVAIGIAILTSRSLLTRFEKASTFIGHLDLVGPAFIILIGILFLIHGSFSSVKI